MNAQDIISPGDDDTPEEAAASENGSHFPRFIVAKMPRDSVVAFNVGVVVGRAGIRVISLLSRPRRSNEQHQQQLCYRSPGSPRRESAM